MCTIRSKCNEGCDVTVVTCADTITYTQYIQLLLLTHELLHSNICHLLLSEVGVNIAIHNLCESGGYDCKRLVSR